MAVKRKADEALQGLFGQYASDDEAESGDEGRLPARKDICVPADTLPAQYEQVSCSVLPPDHGYPCR